MNLKQRITASLRKRFPNNDAAETHFGGLLCEYVESGLSPPHLVAEIETGDDGKFWSCIWEAMLYRHLRANGYAVRNTVRASGQQGPDFCVEHQGQRIWIEATVPAPDGIPADWLAPPRSGVVVVKSKPDAERVLRCTSAIVDKRDKFAEYRAKGIVGDDDCTVIAVNICRLSSWDFDGSGISQLPLVMEALFPVGPLGVPVSLEGEPKGPAQHTTRLSVRKRSGVEIGTGFFLDLNFASVSAVIQGHQQDMFGRDLILATVHNPLATRKLPTALFGIGKEFVAEEHGDEFQISDIRAASV
jgi:hypothetical protein